MRCAFACKIGVPRFFLWGSPGSLSGVSQPWTFPGRSKDRIPKVVETTSLHLFPKIMIQRTIIDSTCGDINTYVYMYIFSIIPGVYCNAITWRFILILAQQRYSAAFDDSCCRFATRATGILGLPMPTCTNPGRAAHQILGLKRHQPRTECPRPRSGILTNTLCKITTPNMSSRKQGPSRIA